MSFIDWPNWFDDKYRYKIGEGIRYFSMKIALNLFHQRGGEIIVETGTIRALDDFGGAGNSTLIFGDYAQTYNKKFWTVDILEAAINLSKEVTKDLNKNTNFIVSDSIEFLTNFPYKIDLLYLDSMDCPLDDDPSNEDLIKSQQHQLKELEVAWDKLTDKSVILLDDNKWKSGGKCKLTKGFLREKGWTCILDDFQSLWIK